MFDYKDMWNSVIPGIISLAANAILRSNTPDTSSHDKPVQHTEIPRSDSHVPHSWRATPSCSNCSGSVSDKASNKKQQQNNNSKRQNVKDVCQFVIPEGVDYEIKLIKQSSKCTETKVSGPKSTQNNQNRGVNNTSHPNQQNRNQKRSYGNQNQQGNKNQQNGDQNKAKGNQNKPKGNQNASGKVQGHQNQKRGNWTSGKNNPDGQNNRPLIYYGQRSVSLSGQNTWMYLGRLKVGTTDFDIKNYLLQKFPGYDFTVETLPLYKDAKLPCFKVKVNNAILDDFINLENWPQGVKITKFIEHFKVRA